MRYSHVGHAARVGKSTILPVVQKYSHATSGVVEPISNILAMGFKYPTYYLNIQHTSYGICGLSCPLLVSLPIF
jgi:hypothetical protein